MKTFQIILSLALISLTSATVKRILFGGWRCGPGAFKEACPDKLTCFHPNPKAAKPEGYCVYPFAEPTENCGGHKWNADYRQCRAGFTCQPEVKGEWFGAKKCVKISDTPADSYAKIGEACGGNKNTKECEPNARCDVKDFTSEAGGTCVAVENGSGDICGGATYPFKCGKGLECMLRAEGKALTGYCLHGKTSA